jgi:hypothetical protein
MGGSTEVAAANLKVRLGRPFARDRQPCSLSNSWWTSGATKKGVGEDMKTSQNQNRKYRRLKELGFGVIPLFARNGMYLTIPPSAYRWLRERYDASEGVKKNRMRPGVQFASCFRATWKRLPLAVRKRLMDYWCAWPSRLQIELSEFSPGTAAAQCAHDGYTLRFRARWDLLAAPESPSAARLPFIIAHELAHAYQHAADFGLQFEERDLVEAQANDLAKQWGFPQP